MRALFLLGVCVAFVSSACADTGDISVAPARDYPTTTVTVAPQVAPLERLSTELVASGLSEPVAAAAAPGIDETFIVERTGTIVTASGNERSVVLDLTDRIGWEVNEQGLLGFAVHPDFPDDPRGFAVYTDANFDVVIESFPWTGRVFDASAGEEVLVVPQPHKYHQGGGIRFDSRGDLWLSFGDGGGIGDRYGNGQNPSTLNGTMVRIDVDDATPYAIPDDSPSIDVDGARPEVWAFGLRNPWRFAFDGDQIVIADVGQYVGEEINVVSVRNGGYNFGWPVMEADGCYEADTCDDEGMVAPVLVLPHERLCAIIGGVVYRGAAIPELNGQYLFGDHCVGWLRSAPLLDGDLGSVADWEDELGTLGMVTSIDVDHHGEVLVTNLEGDVYRIIPVREGD
jgi:hypothetical protein